MGVCCLLFLLIAGCCESEFTQTGTGKEVCTGANGQPTPQEKTAACTKAKTDADGKATCPQKAADKNYTQLKRISYNTCTYATSTEGDQCFVTATVTGTYKCCEP